MRPVKRHVEAGSVLAGLMLSAFASPTAEVEIEDLSKKLVRLQEHGIDVSDFALSPGGYYSQDIVAFVGDLLTFGYATKQSPVKLNEAGTNLCRRRFLEAFEHPEQQEEASRIAQILEIDIDLIKPVV